ncbi:hypothetical protein FBUS_10063 [Fasciolopsis buskii]|uniref:Uncharacterized protein n=1 Tax=Fasciolopsis buskii TaxID=27845 RepID=A0A8E0VQ45_9TREM|nr:hypothetical protein FBUS_10063 [Fasciolopsis buski]
MNGCKISHNTPETDPTVLLGDVIKPGDVLRIHSPWSCITDEKNTKPPLFHSFFWVERVRDRDLPAWYSTSGFPVSSSLMPSPISIACSCLASGKSCGFADRELEPNRCPAVFLFSLTFQIQHQQLLQTIPDSVETVMPQNLNMDCVFVVHSFKLWILKKMRARYNLNLSLRPAILIQFYSGGAGLILLPSHAPPSDSVSRGKLTSWTRPQIGGVYHTQDLLQLPTSHLPRK